MTNDMVTVSADLTVGQTRRQLREPLRTPDFTHHVYAVEEPGVQLCGVVRLCDLLVADDDVPIRSLVQAYHVALHPLDSARAGADRVIDSQLAAMPVTGNDGRLLGIVTAGAAIAQIVPPNQRGRAPRVFA